ncbi:MAG: putative sigma factor [Nocardioides sp.]|nr:putative sigma factor [Nocardioides sp.]
MLSDAQLVKRSLAEPRCFEELVALHGARVHSYLYRRAPGAADDLLSEVWLAAFEGRHRFDPDLGVVASWLFGIAHNVLHAHHRRERRQVGVAQLGIEDSSEDWSAVDARLDAAGVAAELRTALAELSAEERDVLLLVAWEQLTPTEAAHVLGIPAGTARSRLHRARARISAGWPERTDPDRQVRAKSYLRAGYGDSREASS